MSLIAFFLILLLVFSPMGAEAKETASCPPKSGLCSFPDDTQEEPLQKGFQVETVIGSDTFRANGQQIKIWGILTPRKEEAGYMAATWFLETFLKGKTLECRRVPKNNLGPDEMQCFSEGLDVGAAMIRFGLARDDAQSSGGYYQQEEAGARKREAGIWAKQ